MAEDLPAPGGSNLPAAEIRACRPCTGNPSQKIEKFPFF
jgi:hypothetical protein